MGFFKKLFGKESASDSGSPPRSPASPTDGELITLYDKFGREMRMTKRDWRDNVLLGNLQKAKGDPDQLYDMIVSAINDGFTSDVVEYAEHLQRTDPKPVRGATLLGVIYLNLDRLDEAERTLNNCLTAHGEDGYVLTNLAKVHSKRGDSTKAEATLWHALEVDPNQRNGVDWFSVNARERGGEVAEIASLQQIRQLPKSWLAQMSLARLALKNERLDEAIRLYQEAIEAAPRPIPPDMLMQMSGDLGQSGKLVEALQLTLPHFEPSFHGVMVGNNLIKANLDLGRLDHARAIVEKLYAQNRLDFQPTLSFWDSEIAKARVAAENESIQPPTSLKMLMIQGPVWLPTSSPASDLFGVKKEPDAVVVKCFGASVTSNDSNQLQAQLSNTNGRITRALALFLAEQIHLRTSALAIAMQPWLGAHGFAVFGQPWEAEPAVEHAKAGEPAADYLIMTHLIANREPHKIEFRLLRCIDSSPLASGAVPIDPNRLEPGFQEIADKLQRALQEHAHTEPIRAPSIYEIPGGLQFNEYQLRLEQLLAVRASDMEDARPEFLSGEREIIAGNIYLCLANPRNATLRILLAETLRRLKKIHPQAVEEFRIKVQALETEQPLAGPAHWTVRKMIEEVFVT